MKKITRKTGRSKQHESMHVTHVFNIENQEDRNILSSELKLPQDPSQRINNRISSEIDRIISFLKSKKIIVSDDFYGARLCQLLSKDTRTKHIPYVNHAGQALWALDFIRDKLNSRKNIDSLTYSLIEEMFRLLESVVAIELGKYESLILAGKSRTGDATKVKMQLSQDKKLKAQCLYEKYQQQGISKTRCQKKIADELDVSDRTVRRYLKK